MSFKQKITEQGYEFSTLPRGFKEELLFIESLEKRVAASESELDEESSDEDRQLVNEAKETLNVRMAEFIEDLEELSESKKAQVETNKRTKKVATPKSNADNNKLETHDEKTPSEDKETSGSGIAGFVIGGIALLATFGAINYFRRR